MITEHQKYAQTAENTGFDYKKSSVFNSAVFLQNTTTVTKKSVWLSYLKQVLCDGQNLQDNYWNFCCKSSSLERNYTK